MKIEEKRYPAVDPQLFGKLSKWLLSPRSGPMVDLIIPFLPYSHGFWGCCRSLKVVFAPNFVKILFTLCGLLLNMHMGTYTKSFQHAGSFIRHVLLACKQKTMQDLIKKIYTKMTSVLNKNSIPLGNTFCNNVNQRPNFRTVHNS